MGAGQSAPEDAMGRAVMESQIVIASDGAQRVAEVIEALEWRHQRAQEALASAMADYQQLCELPHASERQMHRAVQTVQRLEKRLAALQEALEDTADE
jgi:hypothetical protein